jgi:hypothetical protein
MLFRFASASALVAAASMASAPVAAAEFLPLAPPAVAGELSTNGVNAHNHRWHRRDRIDGGDVVAGVLVIGAIAAIAGAATKADRDRGYRYPERYPYPAPTRPYDYRSGPTDSRYEDGRGLDRAVDMCTRELERSARVDTVDAVSRNGDGWRVSGRLDSGRSFTCSVGDNGRIEAIDADDRGAVNEDQWDDDSYAAARQAQDGASVPPYPGGPLPDSGTDGGDSQDGPEFPG